MVPSTNTRAPTAWALAATLGLALLWGGNSVTIKIGVGALPPLLFLTVRTALGLLFLLVWAAITKVQLRPARGELPHLLGLSLLFSLQALGLILGTSLTLASHSTVLMNTFPFFTAIFAHFLIRGDRLTWLTTAGSLLALAGVALTAASAAGGSLTVGLQSRATLVGDLVVLASAALLGLRTVVSKRLMQRTPPERLLVWMMLLSVLTTGALALASSSQPLHPFSVGEVASSLYTGLVISGFGFVAFQRLLRGYRASRLTVVFLATPLAGVLLSWLLLGEDLSLPLAAGAALVASGIYLVNGQRSVSG